MMKHPFFSLFNAATESPSSAPKEAATPLRQGVWVEYNKHAVVISRGTYIDDVKHGLWREYYDSGALMLEEHYEKGTMHGVFTSYHPNGARCSEGNFIQGHRHGAFLVYDEGGNHVRTLLFDRDELVRESHEGVRAMA